MCVEMKPQPSTLLAETGSLFASLRTPSELARGFLALSCLCLLTQKYWSLRRVLPRAALCRFSCLDLELQFSSCY